MGQTQIKLSQFVDDTTILLGGSEKSLQNVNQEMCRGKIKFSHLGIYFSVNLNDISHMNFDITMTKVKTELKLWKCRLLSPPG